MVLWVKRKSCLKPVSSDPTWTNMPQQSLWICVLLRVWVNFYRYWSFSWSKNFFFFLPNVSRLFTAEEKCCRNLPVNVKASKLIIFTADSSVLAKLLFQSEIMILFDLMVKYSSSIWLYLPDICLSHVDLCATDLILSLFLLLLLGFLYSTTLFSFDLALFSFHSSCMLVFLRLLLPLDLQLFIMFFLYPFLLLFPFALLLSFSTIRRKKTKKVTDQR